ncbi:hypothetical protein KAX14_04440 [Candidatus Bipolaricaulota bacterium]|jgi:hypothetical protein|nr:hypothetical protein [Candidatus Bipolaricaulota bacterium]
MKDLVLVYGGQVFRRTVPITTDQLSFGEQVRLKIDQYRVSRPMIVSAMVKARPACSSLAVEMASNASMGQ